MGQGGRGIHLRDRDKTRTEHAMCKNARYSVNSRTGILQGPGCLVTVELL